MQFFFKSGLGALVIPRGPGGGRTFGGLYLLFPKRLMATDHWVYTDACPTCCDSWQPTGRILDAHLHAAKVQSGVYVNRAMEPSRSVIFVVSTGPRLLHAVAASQGTASKTRLDEFRVNRCLLLDLGMVRSRIRNRGVYVQIAAGPVILSLWT